MKQFWLWDSIAHEDQRSLAILFMRIFSGLMILTHGLTKVADFNQLSTTFLDPIGIGIVPSLVLAIFAEVVCAGVLIFGFLSRIASAILVVNMIVAAFFAHWGQPFASKELALLYLGIFIVLTVLGGGKYSIDWYIFTKKIDASTVHYRNMTMFDRVLRMFLAFVIWYFVLAGMIDKVISIILIIITIPLIVTSFWGFCLLYSHKGKHIG